MTDKVLTKTASTLPAHFFPIREDYYVWDVWTLQYFEVKFPACATGAHVQCTSPDSLNDPANNRPVPIYLYIVQCGSAGGVWIERIGIYIRERVNISVDGMMVDLWW